MSRIAQIRSAIARASLVVSSIYLVQAIVISHRLLSPSVLDGSGFCLDCHCLLGFVEFLAFCSTVAVPRLSFPRLAKFVWKLRRGRRAVSLARWDIRLVNRDFGTLCNHGGRVKLQAIESCELLDSGSGRGSRSGSLMVRQVTSSASVYVACIYSVYRNQWRRLLITDQGLFQVVDTKRPWPSDRPLDEPNSPLRAVRLYSWEQIARFHWSQQSGEHVLHLNVHQPGFGVPQLVSFQLRSLSEEGWQKLDQLLRTHLSGMSAQEPGRALTTSAAV